MYRRIVLSLVALAAALIAPGLARADTVTQWNQNAATVLMTNLGQGPQLSVPHLAMVHGAAYDAVNAIDGGHEGYLLTTRVGSPFDSKDAAAATAAYRVLRQHRPRPAGSAHRRHVRGVAGRDSRRRPEDARDRGRRSSGGGDDRGPDGRRPLRRSGLPARHARSGCLGAGATPVRERPERMAPGRDAVPDRELVPVPSRPAPTRSTSPRYAREYNEVKEYGRAGDDSARSEDQTIAARYWAENPPNTWSRIFRTLSTQEQLSLVENARLYAMLYLTASDALISVWDDKAHYMFWRPITAIRRGDTDGNARTQKEDGWLPLIATPPYPDHPSGHAGLSGSFVATLQDFFRTDHIGWTDTNNGGFIRSFTRFSAGDRRRRRRPRLVGDPLPQHGRAGCTHRTAGRTVPAAALLPAGSSLAGHFRRQRRSPGDGAPSRP